MTLTFPCIEQLTQGRLRAGNLGQGLFCALLGVLPASEPAGREARQRKTGGVLRPWITLNEKERCIRGSSGLRRGLAAGTSFQGFSPPAKQ